jgi:nicotinamide-nucleotide adenylyltransferase
MKFKAAFIGRFQPFHNGHLTAILQILAECENVLVIIGSADKSAESKNPYNFVQRKQLIELALKNAGVELNRVSIVALNDINDDKKWVDYLIYSVAEFETMYTGSAETKRLFIENGRKKIADIELLKGVSGTIVRKKLSKGELISDLVVPPVEAKINEYTDSLV